MNYIDTFLAAIRFKEDYSIFKKGEVFKLTRWTGISGFNPTTCTEILKEMWKAVRGERSSIELNYSRDKNTGYRTVSERDGLSFIYMDFSGNNPELEIFCGASPGTQGMLNELASAFLKGNRRKIHEIIKSCRGTLNIVAFINDPGKGLPWFLDWGVPWYQAITVNGPDNRHGRGDIIVPEMHCSVTSPYIRHLRSWSYDKLTKPLYPIDKGFVARVKVVQPRLCQSGQTWYLGGEGELMMCLESAYVYKTREAATSASVSSYRRCRGESVHYNLYDGGGPYQRDGWYVVHGSREVITLDQWRNELFGPCDGINYYYNFAHNDYSQPN